MNKKIFLILGLALVAAICFIPSAMDPRFVAKNPFEAELQLSYYNFAVRDRDNSLIIIDNGLSRISKVNTEGIIDWSLQSNGRDDNFQFLSEIVVDNGGYIYALNQVTKSEGFKTEREELIRIRPDGFFDKVVYSKTYKPEEMNNHNITRARWQNLRIKSPYITWFEMGDNYVVESKINVETNKFEQKKILDNIDAALVISSISRVDENHVAYSTKRGEIILVDGLGSSKVIYDAGQNVGDQRSSPWWLGTKSDGNLLFTDLVQGKIMEIDLRGEKIELPKTFFTSETYKAATKDEFPYVYYTFSLNSGDFVVTVNDTGVLVVDPTGGFHSLTSKGKYGWNATINRVLFWVGSIIVLFIALYFFIKLYGLIFKKKVLLALKQVVFILPLLSGVIIFVIYTLFTGFEKKFQELSYQQISQFIQLLSFTLPVESLEKINSPKDFMDIDYQNVRDSMHRSINYNKDAWNAHIYFVLYKKIDSKIYAVMQTNDGVGTQHPYTYLNSPDGPYWKAFSGSINTSQTTDAWGSWVYGVGPVYNEKGEIVALIEVGRDMYGFKKEYQKIVEDLLPVVVYSIAGLMIFFILFTLFLLQPLRVLRRGVINITDGHWGEQLKVKGKDEVSELTKVFNQMTAHIQTYIEHIVKLSAGYQHFVPKEFLTQLDRESVTEIQLGDQIQREMTILFSDIRSFTTISESMTPKENFEFLNRYLGTMGPQIRNNNGFIDKYIGDAIMALFPQSAEDALLAAIGVVELLHTFNEDQVRIGQPKISIGLGIHTGMLMLGILGEQERYDGTVISDNVNLASRLEGLTKYFGASIIISETTYDKLENKNKFLMRYLGKIKVKGKSEDIGIYEVLDGTENTIKAEKMAANVHLQKAIESYKIREFKECMVNAKRAYEACPSDLTAKLYFDIAKEGLSRTNFDGWTGSIVMDSK